MVNETSPTTPGAPRTDRARESWLPIRPKVLPPTDRPWMPDVIGRRSTEELRYAVVDEIFPGAILKRGSRTGLAELSVSDWPVVDALGRLRFPGDEAIHIEVDAERLRLLRRRHRLPRKAASRDLRGGDTFALLVEPHSLNSFHSRIHPDETSSADRSRSLDPRTWDWLRLPVYDITADAREAAKLAYFAALTAPLPEEYRSELR